MYYYEQRTLLQIAGRIAVILPMIQNADSTLLLVVSLVQEVTEVSPIP